MYIKGRIKEEHRSFGKRATVYHGIANLPEIVRVEVRRDDLRQDIREKTLIMGKAPNVLKSIHANIHTVAGNNEQRDQIRALLPTFIDDGVSLFEMEYQPNS